VIEQEVWESRIIEQRKRLWDPDARYFLALLLNVADRATVLRFVADRAGGRPEDVVLRWVRSMTELTEDGTVLLLGEAYPPLLPGLEVNVGGPFLLVLQALLERCPDAEIARRLSREYPHASVPPAGLASLLGQLRRSAFRALVIEG